MSAIRLARGYTGRPLVIKFAGCYHGHVDGLLVKAGSGALTHGHPDSAGIPAAYASQTLVLPYNDLGAVEAALAEHGDAVAALIVEPYPANVGLILPDAGYLEGLRALTRAHGVVLIFDEVMTGFRLGLGGVQALTGVTPDMTAMGKIIGGGLPVGAFGGRREIMECLAPIGPVYQAGTLSGNPLAMAAGIAALDKLMAVDAYAGLAAAGTQVREALEAAAAAKGLAVQVPQVGSMFSVYFRAERVRNLDDAMAADAALFGRWFRGCLDGGVYLPPSAYETAFISTAHGAAELDAACEVMAKALARL